MRAGARLAAREPAISAVPTVALTAALPPFFQIHSSSLGYRPVRRIAATACSEVWEAVRGGQRYAAKLPLEPAARRALAAEFRLLRTLTHRAIPRPVEWYDDGRDCVLVLPYLPGGDLTALAGLPVERWARPLLDVLGALEHLHGLGFAHRDVKARNVLLDRDDRGCLIDYGSCRPLGSPASPAGTTAGHRRGSEAETVTVADDLFAFAALADEMLRPDPGRAGHPTPAGGLARIVAASLAHPDDAPQEKLREIGHVLESALGRTGPSAIE